MGSLPSKASGILCKVKKKNGLYGTHAYPAIYNPISVPKPLDRLFLQFDMGD
jgi:hypothetical protein